MKEKRKQWGFSLVETMVAIGVLGTVSYIGFTGVQNIEQYKVETQKNLALENIITSTVNSIRSNINVQKINFKSIPFMTASDGKKVKELLPMAWTEKIITTVEECKQNNKQTPGVCDFPGRLGYVVEPYAGYRGLFKVTIRVTHDTIFDDQFKDFHFIVDGR